MFYSIQKLNNNYYVYVSDIENKLIEVIRCGSLSEAAEIFGGG